MPAQITILDPVSLPNVKRLALNPRPTSMVGLTIATVDNTKPNFDIFLDRVQDILIREYQVKEVKRFRKPGRTVPVAADIIAQIQSSCDFAITGLGD